MFSKILSATAGLFLALVTVAEAQRGMPTKFTVRIENITKPEAFTASNGAKWSLAFSPGLAVVHTGQLRRYVHVPVEQRFGWNSEGVNPIRFSQGTLIATSAPFPHSMTSNQQLFQMEDQS